MPKANKPKASHLKTWRTEIDMKKIISAALLTATSLTTYNINAEEPLILASEYERLIVNWSPNGKSLATVLAYECTACPPKRLKINLDTELVNEHGEHLPIEHLRSKVDWAGTLQTTSSSELEIIKIMLH